MAHMADIEQPGLFPDKKGFLENGRKADREDIPMEIDHMAAFPEMNIMQRNIHPEFLIVCSGWAKDPDISGSGEQKNRILADGDPLFKKLL